MKIWAGNLELSPMFVNKELVDHDTSVKKRTGVEQVGQYPTKHAVHYVSSNH